MRRSPFYHVHLHIDGTHWVVRRHGAGRPRPRYYWLRRTAIIRALKIRDARVVFVHRIDGTVQYVKTRDNALYTRSGE
jgi:hypothetical protein